MTSRVASLLGLSLLLVSCGDDDGPSTTDGGPGRDARTRDDSGEPPLPDASVDARGPDGEVVPPTPPAPPPPPVPPAPPPPGCPPPSGSGPNATVPGELTTPAPTLRHVTLEWTIEGDDDLDGTVTVRYRTGGGDWRTGTPLRRIPAGSVEGFSWANRHSGSLFGLEPATSYEIELYLVDPDGGCDLRTVTVSTRAVPAPMEGAPIRNVGPADLSDALDSANPGDVIELADGDYDGFTMERDGEAGAPIVIRSASGGAVFGSDIALRDRRHVHLVGITLRGGRIRIDDSESVAIVRSTIETPMDGIVAYSPATNAYVADNVITGPTGWNEPALGADGDNLGEGIQLTGSGVVIEHNRVRGFRDCISTMEDDQAIDQFSVDILENDVSECADDGVEADFCYHNCRVIGNRMTNVFIALSSQPGLGGPTWFVRNVVYNAILSAFKLQRGSIGDVVLHNTVVKNGDALGIYTEDVFSRQLFRNNLLIGGAGGDYNGYSSGSGRVIDLTSADPTCDLDYDGLGSTLGTFEGRIRDIRFSSVEEMRAMTTEVHGVQVDLGVFAASVPYPESPFPEREPVDLRLAAGSAAVDVGLVIPGISDAYRDGAPDLGAYELGDALPVYGPR